MTNNIISIFTTLLATTVSMGTGPLLCFIAYQVDPSSPLALAGFGLGMVAGPIIAMTLIDIIVDRLV